jgi:hypothetical protein
VVLMEHDHVTNAQQVVLTEHDHVTNAQQVVLMEHDHVTNAQQVVLTEHDHVTNAQQVVAMEHDHVTNTQQVVVTEHDHVTNAQQVIVTEHDHVTNAQQVVAMEHDHVTNTQHEKLVVDLTDETDENAPEISSSSPLSHSISATVIVATNTQEIDNRHEELVSRGITESNRRKHPEGYLWSMYTPGYVSSEQSESEEDSECRPKYKVFRRALPKGNRNAKGDILHHGNTLSQWAFNYGVRWRGHGFCKNVINARNRFNECLEKINNERSNQGQALILRASFEWVAQADEAWEKKRAFIEEKAAKKAVVQKVSLRTVTNYDILTPLLTSANMMKKVAYV